MKLFVFDTETGGIDSSKHSLLTLAGVVWEDGKIIDEIDLTIAEEAIVADPEALAINKLNLDEIKAKGVSPLTAALMLREFWGRHWQRRPGSWVQLAGHNVAFDYGFLKRLFQLAAGQDGITIKHQTLGNITSFRLLDTMGIALFLALGGHQPISVAKLDALLTHYGVGREGMAHNALSDARATAGLLTRMLEVTKRVPVVNG